MLNRDDRWSLAGAICLIVLAGGFIVIGMRTLAIGTGAFAVLVLVSTAVSIRLRRLDAQVAEARPSAELTFRSAMSLAIGIGILVLGAFLVLHTNLVLGITSVVLTLALGALFIVGAWFTFRASRKPQ